MKKILILFSVFLLTSNILFAQKRKEIKKYHIKSLTESSTDMSTGAEVTRKDSYTKYDFKGNEAEVIHYNNEGGVKKRITYKYNDDDDVTEEKVYDKDDRLAELKITAYNANKDKILESVFDAGGKLLKKSMYTYNKNGMKSERKTYDGSGKLTEVKKYVYEN